MGKLTTSMANHNFSMGKLTISMVSTGPCSIADASLARFPRLGGLGLGLRALAYCEADHHDAPRSHSQGRWLGQMATQRAGDWL